MKVAVVVTEVGRGVGGRFAFQEMVLEAVHRAREVTTHRFTTYSAGISRYSEGGAAWRARRLAGVAATLSIQATREVQDTLFGKRLVHIRTPLQRQLEADAVDLVWFPTTYIEDVGLPFVCTVFDLEHRIKPWFPEVSLRGEFERRERLYSRYLPKATRIVVPNETGRDQVVHFYRVHPENCLTLTHPTPAFAIRAAAEPLHAVERMQEHGVTLPFLLYPAQFWPHKNHTAALDALQEVRAQGVEVSLVLVGSDKGSLGGVRRQIRDRGLEDAVRILGFVEEDSLIALYQHAHCLLYLSRFGPENLPPLEAFALGCPAVVADVPGVHEQLGEAALVVDSSSPAAIADAVRRAGEPAERARLVAAGRARALSWTADDYVRGLIAFLDRFEKELRLWR